MHKHTSTYDILNKPFEMHYYNLAKPQPLQEQPDMRALQRMSLYREGIEEGLTYRYKRRTYHANYVTRDSRRMGEYYISYARYIDSINQMHVRNYEELDNRYWCDEHGDNKIIPFVCQLPGRNHRERWIYGYRYSDCDGQTVFLDTYEDRDDAMRYAEQRAEKQAQLCYEDYERDQEEQRLLEREEGIKQCKDELAALRVVLKQQVSIVRWGKRNKINYDLFCNDFNNATFVHNSTILSALWHNRCTLHKQIKELQTS